MVATKFKVECLNEYVEILAMSKKSTFAEKIDTNLTKKEK